jgi:hypothetical protein
MNVGDSRAVLARRPEPDLKNVLGKASQDLQQLRPISCASWRRTTWTACNCKPCSSPQSTAPRDFDPVAMDLDMAEWDTGEA